MIFFTITKNYVNKYLKKWSLFLLIIVLAFFQQISLGETKTLNWNIGLYCKGNLPDQRLDSFFIIEEKLRFIRYAQFNNDMVNFSLPAIELQITPKELFNRPEGLTINRETLAMKWRNSKKLCNLEEIENLEALAQGHLIFLLKDNKL